MNVKRWFGIVVFACLNAMVLLACTREVKPSTATIPAATVVILGNKVQPSPKCICEDETKAAEARAAKWKAYAEKLEAQLGIPATSSSGGLP